MGTTVLTDPSALTAALQRCVGCALETPSSCQGYRALTTSSQSCEAQGSVGSRTDQVCSVTPALGEGALPCRHQAGSRWLQQQWATEEQLGPGQSERESCLAFPSLMTMFSSLGNIYLQIFLNSAFALGDLHILY